MKKYDVTKINHEFTNLDFAKQWFPSAVVNFVENTEYVLNREYSIVWLEGEQFSVDHSWFDFETGPVTDVDVFQGDFGECIEFIKDRECIGD